MAGSINSWVLFVGVPQRRCPLFGVYIQAPVFGNYRVAGWYPTRLPHHSHKEYSAYLAGVWKVPGRVVLFRLALSWLVQVLKSVASAAFSEKCSAFLRFPRH